MALNLTAFNPDIEIFNLSKYNFLDVDSVEPDL